MGTWGMGPFDNDSAADLVAKLMVPVRLAAKSPRRDVRYRYEEARAAIQIIVLAHGKHGTDILGGPSLVVCLDALTRMIADKSWLEDWNHPLEIETTMRKERDRLHRLMVGCKGCRKALAEPRAKVAPPKPYPKVVFRKRRGRRPISARERAQIKAASRGVTQRDLLVAGVGIRFEPEPMEFRLPKGKRKATKKARRRK